MAKPPRPIPPEAKREVEAARLTLLRAYNRLHDEPKRTLDNIIARLESWQRGNGGQ